MGAAAAAEEIDMTEKKPRPRRVAADEAHAWARNLRLRNQYAKSVLTALTLYVNGEGEAFVAIPSLAEDCEMAPNTVRSRLAWLEQIGAIARFPQWIDENGRRNGEGRGKRTTDLIRLLLDADAEVIEARAAGEAPEHAGSDPVSPSRGEGLNQEADAASVEGEAVSQDCNGPSVALQQPSTCAEGLISEPESEPEDSPPAPPSGGAFDAAPDGWKEFERAFTGDGQPIVRVSIAMRVFEALKPDERAKATEAAKGLIESRRRERKPGAKPSAQTFLREPDSWGGFARFAPRPEPDRTWIAEGSAEYRAVCVLRSIMGREPPKPQEAAEHPGERGIWRVGAFERDLLALAECDPGEAPGWEIIEENTQRFAAWARKIGEWTGGSVKPVRILTGGESTISAFGENYTVPKSVSGLRVPRPWPPRKDGSWSDDRAVEGDAA
jgi:hypothetical protein